MNTSSQFDRYGLYLEHDLGEPAGAPSGILVPMGKNFGVRGNRLYASSDRPLGQGAPSKPGLGRYECKGNIQVEMEKTFIGFLLTSMFGTPVTTGAGDPYTHVWTLNAASVPRSFMLEAGNTQLATKGYRPYKGCVVTGFNISSGIDEIAQMDCSILGQFRDTVADAPVDATYTEYLTDALTNMILGVYVDNVLTTTIKKFDIGVNRNVAEDGFVLNATGKRARWPVKLPTVGGSLTAYYDDDTLDALARAQTEIELKAKFNFSATHYLEILFPECYLEDTDAGAAHDGMDSEKNLEYPWHSFQQNDVEATACKITLVNAAVAATYAVPAA